MDGLSFGAFKNKVCFMHLKCIGITPVNNKKIPCISDNFVMCDISPDS